MSTIKVIEELNQEWQRRKSLKDRDIEFLLKVAYAYCEMEEILNSKALTPTTNI